MHTFAKVNMSRREKKVTAVDNTEELTVHVRGGGEGVGERKKKKREKVPQQGKKKKNKSKNTIPFFLYVVRLEHKKLCSYHGEAQ